MPFLFIFIATVYGVIFSTIYNFLAGEASVCAYGIVTVVSPFATLLLLWLFLFARNRSVDEFMIQRLPQAIREKSRAKLDGVHEKARNGSNVFIICFLAYLSLPIILNLASRAAGFLDWSTAGDILFSLRWWSLAIVLAGFLAYGWLSDRLNDRKSVLAA